MKNKITYYVARFQMFGMGSFLLYHSTGKDSWIAVILGGFLGLFIIYIYHLLKKSLKGKSLTETLKKTPTLKIFLIIFIIFYIYLIISILIILSTFVNSFYLVHTPKVFINISFTILALYITFKGKNTLENLSNFFFYLSIAIIIIFSLFLMKSMDFSNLLPIMSYPTTNILKSTFIFATITSIPEIITIDYDDDFKHKVKDYLWALASLFCIVFFTTICLGEPLLKIYSFPEYSVLKQIKVLKFIENIENISAFLWYFDLFIVLATIFINLKESLPKKYNVIKLWLIVIIAFLLSTFVIGNNYRYIITYIYCLPYVLLVFFLIFIILLFYLKITNKKMDN